MKKIFYTDGINKFGPFTIEELEGKTLSKDTKVWYFGLTNWVQISQLEEFNSITRAIPPSLKLKQANKNKSLENSKRRKPKGSKKIILIVIGIMVICLIISMIIINNQKDVKLYKKIVESSYETDEDFNFYIDKFYRDIEVFGLLPKKPSTLIIKFAKLDQITDATHIHGISFGINDDDRIEIYINPSTWKSFNKAKRYYLIYHELAHDILNINDLDSSLKNEGKLMYPAIVIYERITMDNFIEASHQLFEEISKKKNK